MPRAKVVRNRSVRTLFVLCGTKPHRSEEVLLDITGDAGRVQSTVLDELQLGRLKRMISPRKPSLDLLPQPFDTDNSSRLVVDHSRGLNKRMVARMKYHCSVRSSSLRREVYNDSSGRVSFRRCDNYPEVPYLLIHLVEPRGVARLAIKPFHLIAARRGTPRGPARP